MGLTVGELNVQLEASTKEFNERLDETEKRINELAGNTEQATDRAGKSFLNLAKGVGTLNIAFGAAAVKSAGFVTILRKLGLAVPQVRIALVALTAIVTGLGLLKLGQDGIKLAAAFEQTEVALETLTGSAQAAAEVLETVNEIVLETPFSLTELANVARTMAIVFGDSTETISEFTRITSDIAAISGRNVEQVGQQIQRAVVSGLASAEVLRESGITQLLLEQSGATDAASLSGEALLQAFRDLTAEGGRAFRAAARQTQTLAGALSNAAIAAESFTREFGKALSPAAIIRANATEDAFVSLRAAIKDITPLITAIAVTFTSVFAQSIRLTAFSLRSMALIVSTLGPVLTLLQVIIVGLGAAIETLVRTQIQVLIAAFKLLTGDIEGAVEAFKEIANFTDSPVFTLLGNVLNTAAIEGERFVNSFRGLVASTTITAKFAEVIGFSTEATKVFGQSARNAAKDVDELTGRTEEQVALLEELRGLGRGEATLGVQARADLLAEEIGRVSILQVADEDRALLNQRLLELSTERFLLLAREADALSALPTTLASVNQRIGELAEIDPEAATTFALQLSQALSEAGPRLTDQLQAAAIVQQQLIDDQKNRRIDAEREIAQARAQFEKEREESRRQSILELRAITADLQIGQLEGIEAEIEATNRRIAQVETLAENAADETEARAALVILEQQLLDLETMRADQQERAAQASQILPDVLGRANEQIQQLAQLDPEQATQFALDLQEAITAAGDDPEALVKVGTTFQQRLEEALRNVEIPPTFGETFSDTLLVGIQRAFMGGDIGIGETFADSLIAFGQPALNKLFEDAVEDFGKLLDDVLQDAGSFLESIDFGGLGETFGGLGTFLKGPAGKATIGLVGQGISAALRSDEVTSQAARTVSSAVESTARVRGIVAGPTSIAVAQVDRAISDAFIETNFILRRIEENTRATATQTSDTGTGSVPTGGTSEATQALANEGPSLV